MTQGIYDKLEETLKLLTNINKQLCCEPTPPPPSTTTTSTSTTTSTTTQPGEFFRASWFLSLDSCLRQGVVAQRNGWYNGNTVASIGASNPNFVNMVLVNYEATGGATTRLTRSLRETSLSPLQSVNPTYTTFDTITSAGLLSSIKENYQYAVKIINSTFLSTRNAVPFVKRVSSPNGLGTGVAHDGLFLIGIDFDATGNELEGYNYLYQPYNQINLPGTITLPFPYNSYFGGPATATLSNTPISLYSPSTSWVNNVTTIPAFGITIRENFTIPPGW